MQPVKSYLSTTLDGMAKGLFASLIIGTILKQFGTVLGSSALILFGQFAQYMMGPAIGAGIAYARGFKQYTLLAAITVGAIGAGTFVMAAESGDLIVKAGDPAGAFIAVLTGIEAGRLIEGRTKLDLLFVPAVVILVGGAVGMTISPILALLMQHTGNLINEITLLHPIPMGILLGAVVGIILTLPVSSAALCIAIGIDGLAAGAACAGCCAQMVGFAASSYKENGISGLISQGVGTSMIQMPNIIKNPWILLPPTIAGCVAGLLSTSIFQMETTSVGAGMGTSGLVGQMATIDVMGVGALIPIFFVHIIAPVCVSMILCQLLRKKGLIRFGDMQL